MKGIWKKKALWVGLVLTLAIGMVAGTALPVMAAQAEKAVAKGKVLQNIMRGEVTGKDSSSFKVKNGKGEETNIQVDPLTKFYVVPGLSKVADVIKQQTGPKQIQAQEKVNNGMAARKATSGILSKIKEDAGPKAEGKGIIAQDDLKWLEKWGSKAGFTDLAVGDTAVVYPVPTASVPTAKIVLIIKKPVIMQIKGKIEAVGGGTVVIAGETKITLSYDQDTVFVLKGVIAVAPGQTAQVSYDSEKMLAKRVTVN